MNSSIGYALTEGKMIVKEGHMRNIGRIMLSAVRHEKYRFLQRGYGNT
jgi:hypothetical protein